MSNFFYEHPQTRVQTPLDVYLGNLGPLRLRVYQATPPGPMSSITPFIPGGPQGQPPQVIDARESGTGSPGPPGGPRFINPGPMHTIAIVEMPPMADVIKALEEDALPVPNGNGVEATKQRSPDDPNGANSSAPPAPPPVPSIAGRSLPLLFIRSSDGVGYHSGRTIACENVFQSMDLSLAANPPNGAPGNLDHTTNWIAAAQAAAAAEGGMHGWTLRVL